MVDPGRIKQKKALSLLVKTHFLNLVMIFVPLVICHGQHLLRYQVDGIASREGELNFSDSLSREVYIQEFLYLLQLEGHPTALLSSKTFIGDTLDIRFEAGQSFKWLFLRRSEEHTSELQSR